MRFIVLCVYKCSTESWSLEDNNCQNLPEMNWWWNKSSTEYKVNIFHRCRYHTVHKRLILKYLFCLSCLWSLHTFDILSHWSYIESSFRLPGKHPAQSAEARPMWSRYLFCVMWLCCQFFPDCIKRFSFWITQMTDACFFCRLSLHRLEEREKPASDSTGCVRLHWSQRLRAGYVCRYKLLEFCFCFYLNMTKLRKTWKNIKEKGHEKCLYWCRDSFSA